MAPRKPKSGNDGEGLKKKRLEKGKKCTKVHTVPKKPIVGAAEGFKYQRKWSATCRSSPKKLYALTHGIILDEHMEAFRKTCFGHFVDFPIFDFAKTLCGGIVMHWLDDNKKNVFDFKGIKVRFTELEVAMILHLKIGKLGDLSEAIDLPSPWRMRLFEYNDTITELDIITKIYELQSMNEVEKQQHHEWDKDCLRLYLLYVLEIFLLPRSARHLDMCYVDLAEDLDKFNDHPWGTDCYNNLLQAFEWGHSQRDRKHMCIYGCGPVLQIWGYMHLPMMAPSVVPNLYPRIRGWKHKEQRNGHIRTFPDKVAYMKENNLIIRKVKPTMEELQVRYVGMAYEMSVQEKNDRVAEWRKRMRDLSSEEEDDAAFSDMDEFLTEKKARKVNPKGGVGSDELDFRRLEKKVTSFQSAFVYEVMEEIFG